MQNSLGVWIDQNHATVFMMEDGRLKSRSIVSNVEPKHKATGGERGPHPYQHETVGGGKRMDEHRKNQLSRFYKNVVSDLVGADEVLIAGPGFAKKSIARMLADLPVPEQPHVDVQTTSSRMTDPEIEQLFLTRFGRVPERKAVGRSDQPPA